MENGAPLVEEEKDFMLLQDQLHVKNHHLTPNNQDKTQRTSFPLIAENSLSIQYIKSVLQEKKHGYL